MFQIQLRLGNGHLGLSQRCFGAGDSAGRTGGRQLIKGDLGLINARLGNGDRGGSGPLLERAQIGLGRGDSGPITGDRSSGWPGFKRLAAASWASADLRLA